VSADRRARGLGVEAPTAGTPGETAAARVKVIYVMGAGRSGSTVLGVALGNCDGVFFAGELDKWVIRAGVPRRDDAERVHFWEAVRRDVHDADDLFGHEFQRCLERSSALFRVRDWPRRRRLRGVYRRVSQDLYEAVAKIAGVTQIVDTSHYPLRARELQTLDGIDLYIVFLVRDPRSVVASFDRRDVDERRLGMLATNCYLWLTYLLSSYVFLRHRRDRRLFVRYEELAANPERVLRQVLGMIGSSAPVPDLTALRAGVAFHGNRVLGAEVIAVKPAEPPARTSYATAALQLPWAAVFARLRPVAGGSVERE
jgi:Sulfotransferase family